MTADAKPSPRFTLPPAFDRVRPAFDRGRDAFRRLWAKRWGKVLVALLVLPILGYFLLWLLFAQSLPSAESLLTYQPALPSNVRDINGMPVQTYARERRV